MIKIYNNFPELKKQKEEEERIAAEQAQRERLAELQRQAELERQAELKRQAEIEREAGNTHFLHFKIKDKKLAFFQ